MGGPEHPDLASGLNNFAALYKQLGDLGKSEPLYTRALGMREKALGPEHPDVAASLNNLAELYYRLGDLGKSEALFKRALSIKEKALGPEHPDVASGLDNLADFYEMLGDFGKAMPLYTRALSIKEKALGLEHPDVATSLDILATFYCKCGPLEQPEEVAKLNNLAGRCFELGKFDKAEALYTRVLSIRKKRLGPKHPDVAATRRNLKVLRNRRGIVSN